MGLTAGARSTWVMMSLFIRDGHATFASEPTFPICL